jgi:sulfoxide reductase heme-binding subunit YedZ
MSTTYQPVLWNKFKKQYDAVLWVTIISYLGIFIGCTVSKYPAQNINTTLIRAFGTLAILILHFILIIGPLSRLSSRFLPLLYNRRHLGVSLFIIALTHALLSLFQFHGNGNVHPLISLFTSNLHYNSLLFFPFQTLGFFALVILAAMAFTSHDFWLNFLSPNFWKVMHMLVYAAYGLIILHVVLGIIQFEQRPVLVVLLVAGFVLVTVLHLWSATKERKIDRAQSGVNDDQWIFVCDITEIEDGRAEMVNVNNERVAIFKYEGKLSAVHNVCKHQMGPLGEGKIVDGCITCPWHGYQYQPHDGCAPLPFTEKIATYQLQLRNSKVYVKSEAFPEGTFVQPLAITENLQQEKNRLFFIGWAKNNKKLFNTTRVTAIAAFVFLLLNGIVLSNSQDRLSGFAIDYGNVKKMEGWLSLKPMPNLRIVDRKDSYGNPVYKTILLMDGFKFGADSVVTTVLNGDSVKYVQLSGYLSGNIIPCSDSSKDCVDICNQCIVGTTDNPVMEIENGKYSIKAISEPVPVFSNLISIGAQTLQGEIIDPKCYFGAMNPGQGKAHLSCAARCISGGIMPVLKYEVNNKNRYAVLVGLNGESVNDKVLNFIGMPVVIKGSLSSIDNWGVLKINAGNSITFPD